MSLTDARSRVFSMPPSSYFFFYFDTVNGGRKICIRHGKFAFEYIMSQCSNLQSTLRRRLN